MHSEVCIYAIVHIILNLKYIRNADINELVAIGGLTLIGGKLTC
jgi:hypothetical protein